MALRLLAWAGWAALALLALAGVTISAAALLAASDVGRPLVARVLVRFADDAVAGRLELAGIEVLPAGGVEVRGLRVFDPDGHLVLAVDRARISADLRRLRSRVVGLAAEIEGPSVLVEEEVGGGVSLARAFAPPGREPERAAPGRPAPEAGPRGSPWIIRITSLTVRNGDVWWVDADGATRLEASGLTVDARAIFAPDRDRVQLALRGGLGLPFAGPLELAVRVTRDGDAVRAPVLRARAGDTVLEGLGEWDLANASGRAALTRLAVDRGAARIVAPAVPPGGDLALTGYAESDGATATAALHLEPPGAEVGGGDVALALRTDGSALGLEVDLDRLDPARVHGAAPPGEVTLRARGAAAGSSLADARGRLAFTLARSRLRQGSLGPAEGDLALQDGSWTVRRLTARAPGLAVDGSGRWRSGGAVGGSFSVDAPDLAVAGRNLAALLGASLPPLAGRARATATLSGTEAAPALEGRVQAPLLAAGGLALSGVGASVRLAGPARTLGGAVDAEVAAVRSGGAERARAVRLQARLDAGLLGVTATGSVPGLGSEPVALRLSARREGAEGERLRLEELSLAYPDTRFVLVHPATVDLDGPRVDALELAAGPQRLRLAGGIGRAGRLDARLAVTALALEALPPGILPEEERIAGAVTGEVELRGTQRRPEVIAHLEVSGGRFRELDALDAWADVTWLGDARRLALEASVARGAGGRLSARGEVPVPFAGRAAAPLTLEAEASALPVAEVVRELRLAPEDAPRLGARVGLSARVAGTVGAPKVTARLTAEDGVVADLEGVGLEVALTAPAAAGAAPDGRAGRGVAAVVSATLAGRPAVELRAWSSLEAGELLVEPGRAVAGLRERALDARLALTGLRLADLAGRLGVPEHLAGSVSGTVRATGTAARPRGKAELRLDDGEVGGYRAVSGTLAVDAGAERVAVEAEAALAGEVVVRARGALAAPLERLLTAPGLRAAPLQLAVELPPSTTALARAEAQGVPLGGTLAGRIDARGTLASVVAEGELRGTGLTVQGRPLGELEATLRAAPSRSEASATLRPAAGGVVEAALELDAGLGLDRPPAALTGAPARARVDARALDLGFLAAALPGTVRAASGTLDAALTAAGPLARLAPRGTARVRGGRVAVSEYGDWSEIELDVAITDDAVELTRLDARRGGGTLSASGALRGMASGVGKLTGRVDTSRLAITRAGMDLATLDLAVKASGTWRPSALDVRLDLPEGTVRLPRRPPRELQSLERRKDIVVGRRAERPRRGEEGGDAAAPGDAVRGAAAAATGSEPFALKLRAVAPGRLMVLSDNPRVNLELKADVTYELVGGEDYASGTIEVVRGWVEPIGGRNFQVQRGKVTFTGGPPRSAVLDVEAAWEHPAAVVTVDVTGPATAPEFALSSQPPMDDAQIALLVATGRTELKAGTGGASSITGEEAGRAAAGALATQLFKDVVADRLPFDVALDASTVRAGRYFTDRIYVGYVRRLDAQLAQGENLDEVRVEYEITPRWNFEWRYGNAQSGGASLIWSRQY